jgi:hypothetical protein
MKVQIFLEDKSNDLWRGENLATIQVKEIDGCHNREVVNNAIKPIKNYLMNKYKQTLIISIS